MSPLASSRTFACGPGRRKLQEPSMTLPRRRLIYLLADGAHARFVERSTDTGHFVTVNRIDGTEALEAVRAEQRDEPAGRSVESVGGARHAVGREDAYRRAKAAFASQAATALNKMVERTP